MMTEQDRVQFLETYAGLMEFYGKEVKDNVALMWWKLASDRVTLKEFSDAAELHIRGSKFAPQLSEILDIVRASKWPAPEQAWNMAPKSEYEGGWMCQEMSIALAGCQDSLDRGDQIGARKAFLEIYESAIKNATGEPQWIVSEPIGMSYEGLLQWKADLLLQNPNRRPKLTRQIVSQLEAMTGSSRTESGLLPVLVNSKTISQAKRQLNS